MSLATKPIDQPGLTRDIIAVRIPQGTPLELAAGTPVTITQSLGGSFTIATPMGLARVDAADADALGVSTTATAAPDASAYGDFSEEAVWNALRQCYDPEIPVNIVDLGLIYDLRASDSNGGKLVEIKMTLTAPGCGMGPTIAADAQRKILQIAGVAEARVDLVWDPQWNPSMISPEGRAKLGME